MTKLYKLDTKNKIREWEAYVSPNLTDEGFREIIITHGLQDGKKQTKSRYVKTGKNLGKSNETTLDQQAYLELESIIQSQLDKSYVYDINDYTVPKYPQLAFKYKEKAHTLDWKNNTYYGSRKLNGIRCFVFTENGKVVKYQSRTGKDFKHFPHITKDIEEYFSNNGITNNCILDGEIFHPTMPFEFIASNTNSSTYNTNTDEEGTAWTTDQLCLYMYDFIDLTDETATYDTRFISLPNPSGPYLVKVENEYLADEQSMITLATRWIKEGYEGLMVRDSNASYEFGKRTKYLLKYKVMLQDEFLIKDIYLADNDAEKVMFTLENHFAEIEEYKFFECALKGSKTLNMRYFNSKDSYINNNYLTVDYQALSAYLVPLFPVGVLVREGTLVDNVFVPSI